MTTPAVPWTDAELIARTRNGDMAAYDELYRRHIDGANRVARLVTGSADEAQDVVSEAFTRVLDRLQRGGGPDGELSPYLNTVVRRLAIDRYRSTRRDGLAADPALFDVMPETDDPIARSADRDLVRRAFETLPDRWQQVLWHTEIEGRSPAALAPALGSTPNAVAALAYRAREGLRQAYLSVHLSADMPEACKPYVPKLAAYVRGTLAPREDQWVAAHLEQCPHCCDRRDELMLLVTDLRGVLWPALLLPVVLGGAKTAAAVTGATGLAAAGVTGAKAGAAAGGDAAKTGVGGTAAAAAGAVGVAGIVGGWFARFPKPKSLAAQIATAAAAVGTVAAVVVATAVMAADDDGPPSEDSALAAPVDPGRVGPPATVSRPSPTATTTPAPTVPRAVLPPVGRPAEAAGDSPLGPGPAGVDPTTDPSPSVAPAGSTPSVPGSPAPSSATSGPFSSAAPTQTTQPTSSPTSTATANPTPTPTSSPPTSSPSPTQTTTATPTPSPTQTVIPSPTSTPTVVPSPTPTITPPPDAPPWWWRWFCGLFPWWPAC